MPDRFSDLLKRALGGFRREVLAPVTVLPGWWRYRASGKLPAPASMEVAGLTLRDFLLYSRPWYHDFTALGLPTRQLGGYYARNQRSKEPPLTAMIEEALRLAPENPTLVELFCADGYFGCMAAQKGARVTGIDMNVDRLECARLAARILDLDDRTRFERRNVFSVTEPYDIVLNCGGLYHIDDPLELLRRNRAANPSALIVQSVYSLAQTDRHYFETPAPGWTWGCRFSLGFLEDILSAAGWRVEWLETNELEGNSRAEDRGSVYALCTPAS